MLNFMGSGGGGCERGKESRPRRNMQSRRPEKECAEYAAGESMRVCGLRKKARCVRPGKECAAGERMRPEKDRAVCDVAIGCLDPPARCRQSAAAGRSRVLGRMKVRAAVMY